MALNDQAFSYHKRNYVSQSIQTLYNRTKLHWRHHLTHKDLFDLLVAPKDREILKRVAKITNAADRQQDILVPCSIPGWEHLQLTFIIPPDEKHGFLVPNYAAKGLQKEISDEVKQKLITSIEYAAARSYEWCMVDSVYDALCARCKSPAQIKMFMPTIVSLFRVPHGEGFTAEDDYADRLYGMRPPAMVPSVEPELRKAAIEVGMTITRGIMMSDKCTDVPDVITMGVSGRKSQKVPWSDQEMSRLA